MLTFLDHKGNEIGALTTFKFTNSVNGERSLSGTVHGNLEIEKGWGVRFEDEYYKVIYAKPKSLGKINIVQFDAVHQFFWDFDKSSVYSELDGSYPFQTFLDHIFNGSGYRYNLEVEVGSLRKQNFGLKKRLELFNDLIKHAGVEFQVRGKVVRILERTGTDLSTVVRKKLNLNDLSIEKRIGDFITYQKGLGAWHDENDHSKGRLEVEYVSPLATIYGRLEGEPYVDERFTIAENFLEVLKKSVEDSYSISVQLDMEDLQKAGYRYTRPFAGDYITVIDEDINFKERVRIVSFESEYDIKGQAIGHTVTCNDIGSVKKQSIGYSSLKSSVANVSKETESAIQTANRALVSADGKTTVYFGTEFPQDVPKGTLTKGDTLYLEVGDTTKMYYWNGAEWLEPPVVNDVEAFKESINTEIAQVNQSMQAQSEEHDRQVADILSKTQSVEALANQAKSDAASAIARASQVKTEAIADARAQIVTVSQALNTAKTELQTAIASADQKARDSQASATALRNDLNSQANKILAQAQAQTALTNRVTTVETLADGTKTTVAELSKTVNKATGDIASVTSRTKTVEDTLSQTRTQYDALTQTVNAQTGQIDSINRKTADLQSGIDGVQERFERLKIGSRNYFKNSKSRKYYITSLATQDVRTYIDEEFWQNDTRFVKDYVRMSFDIAFNPALTSDFTTRVYFGASPWYRSGSITFKGGTTALQHFDLKFNLSGATSVYKTDNIFIRLTNALPLNTAVSLENFNLYLSAVIEDYSQSNADFESKIAEYKQTADQNYAGLQSTVSTLDGKVTQNKTEANQTATQLSNRLTSLETYKDGESTRAQAYFGASKTETAKQLTAERTAIATNYVAKSTYTEDVRGTTQKLNEIKTTADTAKQNLANYQTTVDRKLEELTSSTQTLDGKINTASAKVDTVAGQIRTEISEVEGKIPQTVSNRNLATGSSNSWNDFVTITANSNWVKSLAKIAYGNETGIYANSKVNLFVYISADDIVLDSSVTPMITLQGPAPERSNGLDTWGNAYNPFHAAWKVPLKSGNNYHIIKISKIITADMYANFKGFELQIRIDGASSGKFHWRALMVTTGDAFPDYWVKPIDDIIEDVSSVKTTITQTSKGVEQLSTSLSTTNDKVSTAETKIRQLINDVSSKVSQTDYNTLTGRVSSAETAITQNATEISKRLTSTQVNQAILADKQIKDTRSDNQSPQWYWTNYPKQTVEEFKASAVIGLSGESTYAILTTNVQWGDSSGGKVKQTAKTDRATFERYGTGTTWGAWTKIANAGDLSNYTTKTEFQTVKETTSLYERVIGSTEVNVKDKIARIVMADSLFMTEVNNKVNRTSTQVTQLADSYAVKNLTNSGTVLNQLNLNKDGSVKIDGKLVQITGTTYIQDGVISSAKIAGLDAGKILTGTLNAARIATNSITGNHLVFDQAFVNKMTANEALFKQLFAQTAFITSVQAVALSASKITAGVMRAINGAMQIDLDNANITFNQNATINFNSDSNALVRKKGDVTAFVNFADDPVSGGVYAGFGVTSHAVGVTTASNSDRGKFAGMRVYRPNDSLDLLRLIGDTLELRHGTEGKYFYFKPSQLRNNVDMLKLAGAVYTLSRIFMHLSANGWSFDHPSFIAGVKNEMARNWLQDFANGGLPR